MIDLLSRFTGSLLGGALGDALGFPVEFLSEPGEIEEVIGASPPARLPRAFAAKAPITDDTQMTLFTAEGMIRARHRATGRGNGHQPTAIFYAYKRWLSTQTRNDQGRWTQPAHRGWLIDVPELRARRAPGSTCLGAIEARLDDDLVPSVDARPNDSKGCGAIMRSAPIGLALGDVQAAFRLGRDAAVLTHGHPSGYLSAAYFSAVIHQVARDVSLVEAMRAADGLLRAEPEAGEVVAAVERAREAAGARDLSRRTIEGLGGGWVGEEALSIALFCAQTAGDPSPTSVAGALWRACAHAGDSDSTGSLTGNLLGAMHGVDALPPAWLEEVELRDVIERVARDLHAACVLGVEPDPERYPPG